MAFPSHLEAYSPLRSPLPPNPTRCLSVFPQHSLFPLHTRSHVSPTSPDPHLPSQGLAGLFPPSALPNQHHGNRICCLPSPLLSTWSLTPESHLVKPAWPLLSLFPHSQLMNKPQGLQLHCKPFLLFHSDSTLRAWHLYSPNSP